MLYLGMNIGGTKCSVALGEYCKDKGMQLRVSSEPRDTKAYEPLQLIDLLCEDIVTILSRKGVLLEEVKGVGISCGSPLDSSRGLILSPPNLPGWNSIAIVARIEQKLGLPAWLANDANAGALAEWYFGAGQGKNNLVFLTFGTGMGAGIIAEGHLIKGASDMAGEIGHMRLAEYGPVGYGKMGSFEGFCSGGGIAQLAQMRVREELQAGHTVELLGNTPLEKLTAKQVGEAAAARDPLALEIMENVGIQLGKGLAVLIDLLNPELIVIGSIFARCENLLAPAAQSVIEQEALSYAYEACRVVPAQLSETNGDMAALSVAVYYSDFVK